MFRYHLNEVGYYGVPRDINIDGKDNDGRWCGTTDATHHKNDRCMEMEKTFFVQYQYLAFLLLALSLLYYAPYFLFKKVNEDLVSLKGSITGMKNGILVVTFFEGRSLFRKGMSIFLSFCQSVTHTSFTIMKC